MLLRE